MKKLLSAIMAMFVLTLTCAAAEQNPTVTLNGSEIVFADQTAIIKNDRTLVPARGVFEAMGAKVQWLEEERRVQIDSSDNFTRIYLTIDSDNMEVYKFKDIFSSDRTDVTLDVPAQILNDRTMIPLRAVSESFGCKVEWDEAAREVIITTKEGDPSFGDEVDTPYIYLTTEASDVAKDDEFDVYVNMKNFNSEYALSSGSVAINYDNTKLEVVSSEMFVDGFIYASNPNFEDGVLIHAFAIGGYDCKVADGAYVKVTFKALSDDGGELALSTFYETSRGYMTNLGLINPKDKYNHSYTPINMGVDTTPIVLK